MSYIGAQPTTAAFPFDQFSGNGSTTAFTLSYAPASSTSIVVSISGVVQNPNTYSVSGLTLTFSPAPPTGTNNIGVLYLGLPVQVGVPTPGSTAQFALGSAANPSITFIGDTNTGIYSPGADTLAFTEGGTEVMRMDSSGNVGIGISAPSVRLDIVGSQYWRGAAAAGAVGVMTPDPTSGANGVNLAASFSTGGYGPLTFSTAATERMRIDSSGNVLVGTTSQLAFGKLCVSVVPGVTDGYTTKPTTNTLYLGASFLNSSGSSIGYISCTSSATSYVTSSDYRLKENIAPMTGALSVVQSLKPCTYTWKSDGSDGQGFIAHELQEVVPDCVTGEKDAVNEDGSIKPQGIDTSFLVATLTAAIQELKAELDVCKAEIAALKGV